MSDFLDPFHRSLHQELQSQIDDRMIKLSEGSASSLLESASSVAEKYAAQTSYIRALREVLDLCKEIEARMYGGRREES